MPSSESSSKLSCFLIIQKKVVKVLSVKRDFCVLTEGGGELWLGEFFLPGKIRHEGIV